MLSNSWRCAASVLMPIGISCTVGGELSSKGVLREDEEHESVTLDQRQAR